MARKPFKIVNDLDLSGNKLIDVSEILRSNYELGSPELNLTLRAGSEITGGTVYPGGNLLVYAGWGSATKGSIQLLIPETSGTVFTNSYGLSIAGTTATTVNTNDSDITLAILNATVSRGVKITSTLNSTSNTTGALQIAGGMYLAGDLRMSGGDIVADTATTWNVLDTVATTVNAFGAATTIRIGLTSATGVSTVNIATAINTAGGKTINIGTAGAAGSTTAVNIASVIGSTTQIHSTTINLGTSTAALTSVVVGGGFTGDALRIKATASGAGNLTTDVTSGSFNLLTGLTTGTLNIATGGASQTYIGGTGSSLFLGSTSGVTTLNTQAGATLTLFAAPLTVTAFGGATGTITLGNATGTLAIGSLAVTASNATTVTLGSTTTATTISIGTGATASAVLRTINIGTNAAASSTSTINLGSTLGTPNTYLNGNITLGDAAAKTITLTGTISSAGIKMFDASGDTYSILPGTIAGATTVTLPSTSGRYITVGLRTDGLVDMKSIMAGNATTALVPSLGGILYSDANGIQILSGIATSGKVLVSGANAAPYWSAGVFSVALNQSFTVSSGLITIAGVVDTASTLTLPAGALSFPSGIVAGDLLYASGAGTFSRLAGPNATGSILVSGTNATNPSWASSPSFTGLTLSGDLAVNGGDITSSAAAFNLLNSAAVLTVTAFSSATTVDIGKTDATTVINLNGTKDASSSTVAGVLVDGGMGIAAKLFVGGTLGVTGAATLTDDLAVNGGDLTSTATTFNLLNATVTTMNMLAAAATLNIGGAADDAVARVLNVKAAMNIGTATNLRTVNHYGTFNFGGAAGFRIEWNAVNASLDFIKN